MDKREREGASSTVSASLEGGNPVFCRPPGWGVKFTAGKEPAEKDARLAMRNEKHPLKGRRYFGSRNHDEGASGGRSAFRSPDAALEPENEGVHFRRA